MSVLFSVLGCVLYSIGHRFPPIRQPVLVRPDAKTWSQTAGAVQATSRHGWRRTRCDCRAAPSSLTAIAALHSRAWAGASVPPRRLSRRRGWCMRYGRKKSGGGEGPSCVSTRWCVAVPGAKSAGGDAPGGRRRLKRRFRFPRCTQRRRPPR